MPPCRSTSTRTIWMWRCCTCHSEDLNPMSEEMCAKHTCYHQYCDDCVKQACYQYALPAPAPPPVPKDGLAKQEKLLKEAHTVAPPKKQSKPVPIKPEDEEEEENKEPPKSPPYVHPLVKKKHWLHYRPSAA